MQVGICSKLASFTFMLHDYKLMIFIYFYFREIAATCTHTQSSVRWPRANEKVKSSDTSVLRKMALTECWQQMLAGKDEVQCDADSVEKMCLLTASMEIMRFVIMPTHHCKHIRQE